MKHNSRGPNPGWTNGLCLSSLRRLWKMNEPKWIYVLKTDVRLHVSTCKYPWLMTFVKSIINWSNNTPRSYTMRPAIPKIWKRGCAHEHIRSAPLIACIKSIASWFQTRDQILAQCVQPLQGYEKGEYICTCARAQRTIHHYLCNTRSLLDL